MELFPKHIRLNGQLVEVEKLLSKNDFQAEWEKEWLEFLKEWYNKEDSIIAKTSGSTGTPKTITLKKEFIAASAKRTVDFFKLKEDHLILHCLPSRFIAGKLMTIRAIIGKLDLHLVDPSSDFSFLKDQPFRFTAMVPNQMLKLLVSQPVTRNPQLILLGGSAIPTSLEQKLQNVPTACYSSYGMTETATHIALRKLNGKDAQHFYHCLDGISIEKTKDGCLKVHMDGLENSPLQTTDIVELKDEKSFRVLGRADHVIISGGIKYHPEEIERKLEPHIHVPFYISSLPDDKLGEQIVLYIEGDENVVFINHLQEIFEECLTKHEIPRYVDFQQQLNRTKNGKIIRK